MENILYDIGLIIIIATLFAYIARYFKQPLIPAYALAGLVIGPIGFGFVSDSESIILLGEIGVAFLLFMVGIELDIRKLRDVGLIATLGGTIQCTILTMLGIICAILLGFDPVTALYLGLMIAFSSTMVVIKLLSDKNELNTLHGRIIIGILLMEDILAILALTILGTLNNFTPGILGLALLKGISLFAVTIILSKMVFPIIYKPAARSQEMLFLVSISICFIFSFMALILGFSIAIGAFLAGIALANLPYNHEITSKVKPLRDFFATIFFVTLGMKLVVQGVSSLIIPMIIFFMLVSFIKPIMTAILCGVFGYKRRTAFLSAIALSQTSEFSLIIIGLGLSLNIGIDPRISSIAIFLSLFTIAVTSYLIKFDDTIYRLISEKIKFLDRLSTMNKELEQNYKNEKFDIILIGHNRIGFSIVKTIKKINKSLLVVDFNPDIIRNLATEKVPCIYGDIGDQEIMDQINFKDSEIIISTVPDMTDNLFMIKNIKQQGSKALIYVTANQVDEALRLYDKGADYVILPHFLGGHHISVMLEETTTDINKFLNKKIEHINELKTRKEIGHEHPRHERD